MQIANIQNAIDQWRKCSTDTALHPNAKLRESCERTARSLEIERDTGTPVCICCLKPRAECKYRKILNRIESTINSWS